jgi:hypothetical protein
MSALVGSVRDKIKLKEVIAALVHCAIVEWSEREVR